MREFAHLVECDDPALIRKAVVLEKLNGMSGRFAAAAEGKSLDFARVNDGPCVEMEREIASLAAEWHSAHREAEVAREGPRLLRHGDFDA